ncbi:MAG: D-alanine--D-alanine ligase A, partial [Desulfomonilaceae bacterium]
MDDHVSTVVLIYGGRSPEHEVSLRSAASVYDALRAAGYEV